MRVSRRARGSLGLWVVPTVAALAAIPMAHAAASPASGAASGVASTPACRGGQLVSSPSPGSFDALYGIFAVNTTDVWAVGRYIDAADFNRGLIERWDGGGWRVIAYPQVAPNNVLFAVGGRSSTDLWAVGEANDSSDNNAVPLIEHWNGSKWSFVPSPGAGTLFAVVAVSTNDAWAAGQRLVDHATKPAQTLIEHWDGTRWSLMSGPDPGPYGNRLASVAAHGPKDVWAVGTAYISKFGDGRPLVEHWNGARWSLVKMAAPSFSSELRGVSSVGSKNAWAVGYYDVQTPTGTASFTLVEHWNGSTWSPVAAPSPTGDDTLNAVAAVGVDDVWAVGSRGGYPDLVVHWNGRDWVKVTSPRRPDAVNLLSDVSAPTPDDVWFAGFDIDLVHYGYHTLVEQACAP